MIPTWYIHHAPYSIHMKGHFVLIRKRTPHPTAWYPTAALRHTLPGLMNLKGRRDVRCRLQGFQCRAPERPLILSTERAMFVVIQAKEAPYEGLDDTEPVAEVQVLSLAVQCVSFLSQKVRVSLWYIRRPRSRDIEAPSTPKYLQ